MVCHTGTAASKPWSSNHSLPPPQMRAATFRVEGVQGLITLRLSVGAPDTRLCFGLLQYMCLVCNDVRYTYRDLEVLILLGTLRTLPSSGRLFAQSHVARISSGASNDGVLPRSPPAVSVSANPYDVLYESDDVEQASN
jgi:hypothetical protein